MVRHFRSGYRLLRHERMETRHLLSSIATLPLADDRPEDPAPEFSLEDTNATSPTYGRSVSPRDYLGSVSGWYFGFGT